MAGQNIVVGLDVGTTKVVALVGEVDDHGGVSIIGVGEQATQGIKKGSIIDLEGVIKSITQAVEKAEHMSGCHLQTAFISMSGPHLSSVINKGVVAITNKEKEILPEDIHRVLQAAKVVALPQDKKINGLARVRCVAVIMNSFDEEVSEKEIGRASCRERV